MLFNFIYNIIISPIELLIETFYTFFSVVVRYNPVFPIFGISMVISFLCLPLYLKSEAIQNIERNIQLKMKKKINSIKRNFKGNEKYMILSMYYRENHYHPIMALRGSLGLLIQIPFFIAAYHFLSNLDSLHGISFLFLNDLGRPDNQFSFIFPFFHYQIVYINILPFIMVIINIISGYIYAKNYDYREKLQLFIIAFIFLVLLYNSPSGLVLYWIFNNLFSLFKNIVLKYKNPKKLFFVIIFIFLFLACIYVIFFRSTGKSGNYLFKFLSIGFSLFIISIPLFIKFFNNIGNKYFSHLKDIENTRIFIISISSMFFLCGLVIPLNIISSDPASFSFLGNNPNPLSLIIPAITISLGIYIFWPCCIFYLFNKKIKLFLTFVSGIILIYSIFNVFIFYNNNGTLSTYLTYDSISIFNNSKIFIFNNLIVLIGIVTLFIFIFNKNKLNILSSLFTIVLIGGLFITIWKIFDIKKEYNTYTQIKYDNETYNSIKLDYSKNTNTINPVIHLSKFNKNVIVIMLDRAINSYFPIILEERPELNLSFSGFTYYPNTVSFFRATIFGAPPIFGGYEYIPENFHIRNNLSMADKHDESLLLMPLLFKNIGYDTYVFDTPYVNYKEPMNTSLFTSNNINSEILTGKYSELFFNEFPEKRPKNLINYDVLLRRNFVFFSLVSVSPPLMRKAIYRNGNYWSSTNIIKDDMIPDNIISDYTTLFYLPQISTYDNINGSLTIMVNNLTHSTSYLQYPDYTIATQVTNFGPGLFNGNVKSQKIYHVNAASYLLLAKWFDELKNNNVYDNTRIIIVSDHDELVVKPQLSKELNDLITFYNPILLVKDFNSKGQVLTNYDFMTTADVPLIATSGIILNPKNPFTGNNLEANKENGINIFLGGSAYIRDYQSWEALDKNSSFYHVKDNIFDINNWTKFTKKY